MPERAGFRFAPRSRRGLVAGVRPAQAVIVVAALLLAVVALDVLSGGARLMGALVVVGAVAFAFAPLAGRTPAEWLPVAWAYVARGAAGERRATPEPPSPRRRAPGPLGDLEVLELEVGGGTVLGALHDRREGTLSAVLVAEGGGFALADDERRGALIGAWSSVLASLASGTSPTRVQWIVRSVPDDARSLRRRAERLEESAEGGALREARENYRALLEVELGRARRHETLVVVTVRAPREASRIGAERLELGRALLALERRCRDASIVTKGALRAAGLRAHLRRSFDPMPVFGEVHRPWPVAIEERWGAMRTDGTLHATYWIAEWPRQEVGSDFLLPLLDGSDRRAVSVVMAPVPPERARREAERARTGERADHELRQRHGFLASARNEHERVGVLRREAELAEGHAAYRFSGYVTVSARGEDELEEACSRLEQAGALARLELRRLWGGQAAALCCTLPCGRGCS
jgi:hypothetical protein